MVRLIAVGLMFLAIVACSPVADLDQPAEPMGDFKLGFNVIQVVDDVTKGPVSKDVTEAEWEASLQDAFDRRFSRFDGDHFYHLGVTVLGYVVAQPGIPIVLSPKSILIFEVIVIDNATQAPLNQPGEQFTVIESFSGSNLFGSGITSSKEEQIADLAAQAAQTAETWLRTQPWFYESGAISTALAQPSE
ncbi:MAG: hypothetical protein AAF386_02020 [Pseudomonadota bacterium]